MGGFTRRVRNLWPVAAIGAFVVGGAVPTGHVHEVSADFTFSSRVELAPNQTSKLLRFHVLPGERLVLDQIWASGEIPRGAAVDIELDTRGRLPQEEFATPTLIAFALEPADDGPVMMSQPIEAFADPNEEVAVFVSRSGGADQPLSLAIMVRGKRIATER